MNPKLMVKKGGKCPPGDINTWFFEGNGLKDHVHKKLPSATASKMQVGTPNFGRFPENLLISRRRFGKAFQVPSLLCVSWLILQHTGFILLNAPVCQKFRTCLDCSLYVL